MNESISSAVAKKLAESWLSNSEFLRSMQKLVEHFQKMELTKAYEDYEIAVNVLAGDIYKAHIPIEPDILANAMLGIIQRDGQKGAVRCSDILNCMEIFYAHFPKLREKP